MRIKKQQNKTAKTLFKNSLANGLVDDAKARHNLKILIQEKPHGFINILKIYKRLIIQAKTKEELIIETPQKLDKTQEAKLLGTTGAKRIVYKLNPKMVFGAKIVHGDWILENSLQAKLKQLQLP